MSLAALRAGHSITLLRCGAEFFPALCAAIDASVHEVRLETYIFEFDEVGQAVADALVRAAIRGVAVYLVMDGIGTPQLTPAWAQRLTQSGVRWHRFSPLGSFGVFIPGRWRRMHRKLCVVDGDVAFCGGINIIDDNLDPHLGVLETPRFDFALQVRGPLVADVRTAMVQFWARLEATRQLEHLELRHAARSLKSVWVNNRIHATPPRSAAAQTVSLGETQGETLGEGHGARAALVLRDNVRHRIHIEKVYRKVLGGARREVILANAYFAPSAKIRRALMDAVRRGVRVRLLLHGRYENFMQYHAARPLYGALLQAGVEIYEYHGGLLHAKVAVVDGHWATVGSSNLDPLSLQLAREANVVLEDVTLAKMLQLQLEQAMAEHGKPLDAQTFVRRPWWQRQQDWAAYAVMRIILFLMGRRY